MNELVIGSIHQGGGLLHQNSAASAPRQLLPKQMFEEAWCYPAVNTYTSKIVSGSCRPTPGLNSFTSL